MTRMHVAYSGGQHESTSWCEGTVPAGVTSEGLLRAEQTLNMRVQFPLKRNPTNKTACIKRE